MPKFCQFCHKKLVVSKTLNNSLTYSCLPNERLWKVLKKKQTSIFFKAPHCSRLTTAKKIRRPLVPKRNSIDWIFLWNLKFLFLVFFIRRMNKFWKSRNLRDTVLLGSRSVVTVFLQCLFCFGLFLILRKLILHSETFFNAHLSETCFRAWLLFILKLLLKIRNGESCWSIHLPCSFLVLCVFVLKVKCTIFFSCNA